MKRLKRLFAAIAGSVEPSDWWGAILFGLVMALIFTLGAGSSLDDGETSSRDLLVSVVGCNVAWAMIMAGMFIVDAMFERGSKARLIMDVQKSASEEEALALVRDHLDRDLEVVTSEEDRERLHRAILVTVRKLVPPRNTLRGSDLIGAGVVFVLVTLTTLPAIVSFLVIDNVRIALRVSNVLMVLMLFLVGFLWAGQTNTNRWVAGLCIMLLSIGMVGIAELLGG